MLHQQKYCNGFYPEKKISQLYNHSIFYFPRSTKKSQAPAHKVREKKLFHFFFAPKNPPGFGPGGGMTLTYFSTWTSPYFFSSGHVSPKKIIMRKPAKMMFLMALSSREQLLFFVFSSCFTKNKTRKQQKTIDNTTEKHASFFLRKKV